MGRIWALIKIPRPPREAGKAVIDGRWMPVMGRDNKSDGTSLAGTEENAQTKAYVFSSDSGAVCGASSPAGESQPRSHRRGQTPVVLHGAIPCELGLVPWRGAACQERILERRLCSSLFSAALKRVWMGLGHA